MRKSRTIGLVLAGGILTWSLVGPSARAATPDAWITTKARIALLTTDGAGRNAVKVDTEHGKITLHGRVDSQTAKDKAEGAVRGIDGVTGVRNLLQIVPEVQEHAVKASDHEIKEAVESAMKRDRNLEDIDVKSVDKGVVLLGGHTTTLAYKLAAIEAAYGCPGVQQVASGIETHDK
jgi:hyperosmotically inducible periplasmic protein